MLKKLYNLSFISFIFLFFSLAEAMPVPFVPPMPSNNPNTTNNNQVSIAPSANEGSQSKILFDHSEYQYLNKELNNNHSLMIGE